MKKTQRAMALLMTVCVLVSMFAAVPFAVASGYKNVYGKTLAQVRVRARASLGADIEDNIVRSACVYVLETDYLSGGETFVRVKYRDINGDVATGWVCQHDGKTEYIRILSTQDAKDSFNVSGGNLPSTRVGTMDRSKTTASSGSSSGSYGYLQLNSQGDDVRKLQTKLKALGYYDGSITGNFGTKTEQAVKDYQKKNGLYVDGIAGPSTQAKIFATSSSSSSSSGKGNDSILKLGATGDRVRKLQQDLTTLKFYSATISGHFGAKTETAVKAFQKKYGLTQDGVAGDKTLDKIGAVLGGSSSSSSSNKGNDSILKLDAQGDRVKKLQQDLTTLKFYSATISGHYGAKTEAAVKAFQKKYGLTQDGVAGEKTLEKIAEVLAGSSSGTSSSTVSGGTLKLNSEGADVRNLQINLEKLGYYTASITGHYGEKTEAAVKAFQSKNGLKADGIAGSTTLQKIAALIKGSSSGSSSTLKYGSEGEMVKKLQQKLLELKIYSGDVTGHYGYKTVAAVKAYQQKNNISDDGIAGKETLALLGLTDGSSSSSSGSSGGVTLTSKYGVTTKDKVIVRSYYTTSSNEKTRLAKGTYFEIISTHTSGSYTWLRIEVNGTKGYLRSDMAKVLSAAEAQEYLNNKGSGSSSGSSSGDDDHAETIGMIIVTGSTVNLRASAGASGAYVGKATKDSVYSYTTTQSVSDVIWYKLSTGAWICGTYARKMTNAEVEAYKGQQDNSGYYTLRYDMDDDNLAGTPIRDMQAALKNMGIYSANVTGHYGTKTQAAVKVFQAKYGLKADGVAGAETQKKIAEVMTSGGVSDASIAELKTKTVYNISWDTFKSNMGDFKFGKGETAVMYDIKTGISMRVKCQSTGFHADIEPLTAADTNSLLRIYGVTQVSNITYIRRPVLLITSTGHGFAGSIYGQCHGDSTISNNNYNGQFCLHLKGSKIHSSGVVDDDHQKCVSEAANWATKNGYTLLNSYSK